VRPPLDTWAGGIIALRVGLDSADTERFPEDTFGEASRKNEGRLTAIAAAFAARGAAEGDAKAATGSAMASRHRDSMNDVGWRIWP